MKIFIRQKVTPKRAIAILGLFIADVAINVIPFLIGRDILVHGIENLLNLVLTISLTMIILYLLIDIDKTVESMRATWEEDEDDEN